MKKRNEDNPENQDGLGDVLPADVLKMINELLERMHQAENNKQGSKIEIVYVASGGQHVETQINIGAHSGPPKGREKGVKAKESFNDDTPLSALFRENHHEALRKVIESWRPYLTEDVLAKDELELTSFQFDFTKIRPVNIYMDLAHLINHDALCVPMSVLAVYMFRHSSLSKSEKALYVQLKRYRCMCK
jgi:hypothetical protein